MHVHDDVRSALTRPDQTENDDLASYFSLTDQTCKTSDRKWYNEPFTWILFPQTPAFLKWISTFQLNECLHSPEMQVYQWGGGFIIFWDIYIYNIYIYTCTYTVFIYIYTVYTHSAPWSSFSSSVIAAAAAAPVRMSCALVPLGCSSVSVLCIRAPSVPLSVGPSQRPRSVSATREHYPSLMAACNGLPQEDEVPRRRAAAAAAETHTAAAVVATWAAEGANALFKKINKMVKGKNKALRRRCSLDCVRCPRESDSSAFPRQKAKRIYKTSSVCDTRTPSPPWNM